MTIARLCEQEGENCRDCRQATRTGSRELEETSMRAGSREPKGQACDQEVEDCMDRRQPMRAGSRELYGSSSGSASSQIERLRMNNSKEVVIPPMRDQDAMLGTIARLCEQEIRNRRDRRQATRAGSRKSSASSGCDKEFPEF